MTHGCIRRYGKEFAEYGLVPVQYKGGSVLYAPLAHGSVHIDDLAAVGIMVACTPLPLC